MSVVAELSRSEHDRIQRAAYDALQRASLLEYEIKTLRGEVNRLSKSEARHDRRFDALEMGHIAGMFGVLHLCLAILILLVAFARPESRLGTFASIPFLVAGGWMVVSSVRWSRPTR